MPSLSSYLFRPIAHLSGTWLERTSLAEIRAGMALGGDRLVLPAGMTRTTAQLGAVPVEVFTPRGAAAAPVFLYLHGGGFVLGLYNGHRMWCADLAHALGMRLIAVDYRLAPEHPFPAGLEDCAAVYRALLADGVPAAAISVGGDSAGGNLTLALCQHLRDQGLPQPAAGVCLSAAADLTGSGRSLYINNDPMLRLSVAQMFYQHYVGDRDPQDPRFSPLLGDLRGLPPLLIQVGGDEILLHDSTRLAEKAKAQGVTATLEIYAHMWHGWHLFAPLGLAEARRARTAITHFVRRTVAAAPREGLA